MDRPDILAALAALAEALPPEGAVLYARGADGRTLRLAGDVARLTSRAAADFEEEAELWWDAVHPDDRDAARAACRELPSGESAAIEYRMVRPSGGESWLRDTMRRLSEEEGGGLVGTLVSVGLERSFRAQIAALEARIWQSQRLESLGALSGSVAHDFNNLLTTILSSAQLLESQVDAFPREAERDLHLIQDAARRGAGLVRQILHFASRRQEEVGVVDINSMVSGLEPILRRRVGLEVRLEVRIDGGTLATVGNAAQLEQVLLNLVVNASEATPDGGMIAVETGMERVDDPFLAEADPAPLPAGSYVRISVRDRGGGVSAETRARIFEPFYSTKRGGGSGLGLSTVQRIVRAQGGGIRLETKPGFGSTFHVYLPEAQPAAVPVEVRAASLAPPRGGARVLVAEDDDAVRSLLERLLKKEGHAVVAVASAAEAIRAFERARPVFEVLLADIVMADRSGPELATALRARSPGLAVAYISGYGADAARTRGVGDDVFLAKPFSLDHLREAVARAQEVARDRTGRPQGRASRA